MRRGAGCRQGGPLCEGRGLAEPCREEAPAPGSDTPLPLRFCSYQRFANCYRCFYKLQPEMTRSIYDQFVSQLQTSIKVKGEAGARGCACLRRGFRPRRESAEHVGSKGSKYIP